ncbi:hypothetical protein [Liquorilactobacillus sicerae]|uniref:hypothetical protein n=1 Tax=Liquorilactobacillus sicerae TaxID=1416943 RepID=UPI0024817993|nr:hypothetical protein [Liquorilactobacillus sicerae]
MVNCPNWGFEQLLQKLQHEACFDQDARIAGKTTIMVIDCHKQAINLRYKSLIIDLHQGLIVTSKTTKCLLNQWIASSPFGLSITRTYQRLSHGKVKSLPHVLGEIMFVPIGGATQYSTTWLGMHYLIDKYSYSSDGCNLNLTLDEVFQRPVTISIPVCKHVFEKQLKDAQSVLMEQFYAWQCLADQFQNLPQTKIYQNSLKNIDQMKLFSPLRLAKEIRTGLITITLESVYQGKVKLEEVERISREIIRRQDLLD